MHESGTTATAMEGEGARLLGAPREPPGKERYVELTEAERAAVILNARSLHMRAAFVSRMEAGSGLAVKFLGA